MGHSTGCQDAMHYLTSKLRGDNAETERPHVDGALLQAPVSDREGFALLGAPLELARAEQLLSQGRGEEVLSEVSAFFGLPICARRWVSLMARGGEDDYLSSDLDSAVLENTFGVVGRKGVPLLVLYSGADEYVPIEVDKVALLRRWADAMGAGGGMMDEGSGVITGASHNLSSAIAESEELKSEAIKRVREGVFDKIVTFLLRIESQ